MKTVTIQNQRCKIMIISAWQHIMCLARYMLSPVRLSVRPYVGHTGV